jgi:biotin carboxylase
VNDAAQARPSAESVVLVNPLMTGAGFKQACADRSLRVVSVYTLAREKLVELDPGYTRGDDVSLHCTTVAEAIGSLDGPVSAVIATSEPSVAFADELAAQLGLPGNPTHTSAARRNKVAMRGHAVDTGVPIPRFQLATVEQIPAAVNAIGYPAILKQPTGAGAYGVHLLSDDEDLAALTQLESRDLFGAPVDAWLVEEYVRGREFAVNGFSHSGSHEVLDVWEYRQPGTADYDQPYWDVVQVHPSDPDFELARDFVLTTLKTYEVRLGPSHTEIKMGPDGPVLIEIASRLPGAHITDHWARHSPIRPYADVLAAFLGEHPGPIAEAPAFNRCLAITCIVNNQHGGVLTAIHGLDQARTLPGVDEIFVNARPGQEIPKTTGLDSVAVVVLISGADPDVRDATIATVRTTIRLELA